MYKAPLFHTKQKLLHHVIYATLDDASQQDFSIIFIWMGFVGFSVK